MLFALQTGTTLRGTQVKIAMMLLALAIPGLSFGASGFANGNVIHSVEYRGTADLVCSAGYGNRVVFCNGIGFDPGSHDRFVTTQKTTAKKVEFKAVHPDGSTRKKSTDFDSKKNQSDWVNLTSSSLFQRPLLDYGVNKVSYQLKNGSKVLESGNINMEVRDAGIVRCATVTIFAFNENDCQNDNFVCNQYFNQTVCN